MAGTPTSSIPVPLFDWPPANDEAAVSEPNLHITGQLHLDLGADRDAEVYDELADGQFAPVGADRHVSSTASTEAADAGDRAASSTVGSPAVPSTPVHQEHDASNDSQPVFAAAARVISRALESMAASETRPLLDEPLPAYRLRRLGDADLAVFPVTLSAGAFGWTADAQTSDGVLDAYAAAGGNSISTSDAHAGGRSETILGGWLRSRVARPSLILSSKIGRSVDFPGLSAQNLVRATDASLRRLGVDYLDVLCLAGDDREVPLEETLTAADSLIRAGKVRYLSAAGYHAHRLMEARILSGQLALPRFVAVQAAYSVLERREVEVDLAPLALAQHLAVLPAAPLAGGFLTGRFGPKTSRRDSSARADRALPYLNKHGFRAVEVLKSVADEHGVQPASAALAWLLTKPQVVSPIAAAATVREAEQLVRAASVHLTRHQVTALDRLHSS